MINFLKKKLTKTKKDVKIDDKTFFILDQIVEFEDEFYHPIIILKGKYKNIIFILVDNSEYIIVGNPDNHKINKEFDDYILHIIQYMQLRFKCH